MRKSVNKWITENMADENEDYQSLNQRGNNPKSKKQDIKINNNRKERKIVPNLKLSDKQRMRNYKTNIAPRTRDKILHEERDDELVRKIREAFGLKNNVKNSNYGDVNTYEAPEYIPPKETGIPSTSVGTGGIRSSTVGKTGARLRVPTEPLSMVLRSAISPSEIASLFSPVVEMKHRNAGGELAVIGGIGIPPLEPLPFEFSSADDIIGSSSLASSRITRPTADDIEDISARDREALTGLTAYPRYEEKSLEELQELFDKKVAKEVLEHESAYKIQQTFRKGKGRGADKLPRTRRTKAEIAEAKAEQQRKMEEAKAELERRRSERASKSSV